MQNQSNQTVPMSTPSNYYGPTGQPTQKSNRKPIIIITIIVCLCLIGIIIAAIIVKNLNGEEDELATQPFAELRQDSSTLRLYAKLREEISLSELQKAVSDANIGAEIFVTSGGGTISIPDETDAIYFYIDETANTDEFDENEEVEPYYTDEEVNEINKYKPTDTVYYIRYARQINDEEGIGISYAEELGEYEVYNGDDFFNFPTKEEAIEAYLSAK